MSNGPGKHKPAQGAHVRVVAPVVEKHPSWINARVPWLPNEEDRKKSLANLPNTSFGLLVLREIRRCFPKDYLLTTDLQCHTVSRIETPDVAPAEDTVTAPQPDPDRPYFTRLKVQVTSAGQPVEVANIPASEAGRRLIRHLRKEYPEAYFYTTDYGCHRFSEIKEASVEELNTSG